MSKFEERKKLLVAESEVYRQLLRMELQTFKVYTTRTKRRLTSATSYLPLVMSGVPFLANMFMRKKGRSPASSFKRMTSLVMLGWKTYQRFGGFFGRAKYPTRTPEKTAAEEYLSKRL
jgi:hypothetical protein